MKKAVLIALACVVAGFAFGISTGQALQSYNSAFSIGAKSSAWMQVGFTLPEYTVTDEYKGGVNYKKISIADAGTLLQSGMPEFPTISTSIAVPIHGSVSIEVISSQQHTVPAFIPYPVQQGAELESPKSFHYNSDYYSNGGNYPEAAIQYGDPMILRDFRIVTVQINPFAYNAQTGELTVHDNIQFRLNFDNNVGINELAAEPETISSSFANIYESMILNFNDYRNRLVANTAPRILMIYGNSTDPLYQTAINEFALWKRQKGADVMLASTATTEAGSSTTSIRNYILAKYNDLATRPDFVVLIGDTTGSYAIPAYSVSSGGADYPYTHLAGTDILGDCFIGRISVENLSQLKVVLNKTYLYERDINLNTAGWLNKMLLEADTAPSGISTVYISKYIKEMALYVNPNYTFTELYGTSPFTTPVTNAMNQGVGFYSFRGYIDFSAPNEGALSNGFKLPHAITITCGTGNYSGSLAETEQMLRYGTTAAPKGTVTAIGMSTSSTHTTFNNVLHGGIFAGLFAHDMRTMGEALLHGKLYMAQIFGVSAPASVNSFTHWCNLMGDPTMEVYTGIPNHFNVQSDSTISLGLTLYDVVVTDSASVPVSGAAVTLSMGSTIISRGFTLEDGSVILILPSGMTVGDAVLTVSAHNFRPQQTTIPVESVPTLVPDSMIVNDVTGGALIGNGNGIAGSGETVEVTFGLTNTGTTTISGISGTISSENTNVVILNPTISYPAISGGEFGTNATPIVIQIAPNTPHESMIRLYLHLTDSSSVAYVVSEFLPVESAKIEYVSSLVSDGNNQFLDPGETAEFKITIKNIGTASVSGINATLHSMNDMLAIPDNMAVFGGVAADSLVTCTTDGFTLSARPESIPGTIVPMQMHLFNDAGFDQNVEFMFTLGHTSNHDPLGPDSHGYVIYDWLDIGYPEAPVYDWHGIAPSEGGLGTALPISDGYSSSDEGDQEGSSPLAVVNLPFPFQFYGRLYQQITVCSNGFIALGVTANAEFRNFRLPGAMGPNPMIAAFWDDLATVSGSGIYTWYNVNNQTFTIEWYNLRNGGGTGTSPETFQVILYNQAVYPTSFGDGPIKIQYHTFNNIDNQSGNEHGNYCTIGIEDHTGKVGLEYTFNNTYPIAAAPLSNRKAIYITNAPTFIAEPHLIVNGTYINDDNNNGVCEPNEDISLGVSIMNSGNVIANDINAVLSTTNPFVTMNMDSSLYYPIAPGDSGVNRIPYTFHVSPTCPDGEVINFSLHVTAGEDEWDRAFSFQVKASSLKYQSFMVDDHAANFNGIVDTGESVNLIVNLLNESVVAASNVSLNLISSNAQLVVLNPQLTLDSIAPNDIIQLSFQIDCAAVPSTVATLPFQLTASSSNGSPLTAEFQVLYNNPDIAADFELNRGSFVPETGWAWGTPSQFAPHSGQKLWATNLSGNYPDLVQYNLYSPAYLLSTGSVMSFYHRYGFENNVDGANVSISSDGGETWTVIPPVGAYNANSLGALDGETGWTGVTTQWLNPSFDLSQYAGQNVMFRFRFGSDAATSNTGWFIDDFQLSGVNKKQGYLHGLLYPTSGISPVYGKVSSNQRYTTHPDVDGNYMLFLPYGLHSVTASLENHQSSILNAVTISAETPVQYADFTLMDLPKPIGLNFVIDNETGVLTLNWEAPFEPVLPLEGYNVYRKFDAGLFELMQTVAGTSYSETLTQFGEYHYYIKAQYQNVEGSPSDLLVFSFPYSANPQDNNPALVTNLANNYPNPFNPSTTISFSLAKAGRTSLAIYNLKGQLVKRLLNGEMNNGQHKVVWNGLDENNRSVASGMYLYRLESGEYKSVKKMLLMK